MQVLDRYILKLWFAPFIGFFLVVNIVLLFGRLLSAIQAFGDNPIDGMVLAEMLFAILPYFLILTLPLAFFFALLKVLSYLHENSEFDALVAAGVSPFRLLKPMFAVTLVGWGFLTWTAMEWMPAGQRAFNELYYAVQGTASMPTFTPGQFIQGLEGVTIYHDGKDEKGYMQQFILEDRRVAPADIYLAKYANIQRGESLLVLTMYEGVHLEGQALSIRATSFDEFSLSIDIDGVGSIRPVGGGSNIPSFLSMMELKDKIDLLGDPKFTAEWHRRWLLPSTVLILFLFALPFSSQQKRGKKSGVWMWSTALVLVIYNTQILLHKKAALGQVDVWVMWAGQLLFMFTGLLLSFFVVKYSHYSWRAIFKKIF